MKRNGLYAYIFSLSCIILTFPTLAQNTFGDGCMMFALPLEQKTTRANLVIEGTVIDKQVIKNPENNTLYTNYSIEVYTLYKGNLKQDTVVFQSLGGRTESEWHIISGSLHPQINDKGFFFLIQGKNESICIPYGAAQAFIKVTSDRKATDTFRKYENPEEDIRKSIRQVAGQKPTYIKAETEQKILDIIPGASVPVITSFSPTSISAGTEKILIIKGSGFGTVRGAGKVEFKNGNDGGNSWITPIASDYTLWTDTEVRVKVPSFPCAGTGNIRLTNNVGLNTVSAETLAVDFSYINIHSNNFSQVPVLANTDNRGGISFRLNQEFYDNEPARETFIRSFTTWRCNTGVNFKIGPTTNNNTSAGDGENVIRFAKTGELPEGVLGRCLTRLNNCLTNTWFVAENDLEFSPEINWNFSEDIAKENQIDFESVTLHELGHAHLLGHIIKNDAVMHYAIGHGQTRRTLNRKNDIEGGQFVLERSSDSRICGPGNMVALAEGTCTDPEGPFEYVNNRPGKDKPVLIFFNYIDKELVIAISGKSIQNKKLRVSDISGRILAEVPVNTTNKEFYQTLSLANLPQAMYIYSLFTENERFSGKFIIQQ